MKYSKRITNNNDYGYSDIFISMICNNGSIPYLNVKTIYQAFMFGFRKNPIANCLGYIVKTDPIIYKWDSYVNILDALSILGSRLLDESYLSFQCDIGRIDSSKFIGIFSKNCPQWVITDLACSFYSYISVPIYDTFTAELIQSIIQETQLSIIFSEYSKLDILYNINNLYKLKKIVCYDKVDNSFIEKFKNRNIELVLYADFCDGIVCKPHIQPKPEYVATICYTSGTTGKPKGVVLTHANIISAHTGVIYNDIILNNSDVHISYLPLSHIFERVITLSVFYSGASIGFSRGDLSLFLDDIQALKPSIFPSVPRLYNYIYKMIMDRINNNIITKNIFKFGYNIGKFDYSISNVILEKTLFKSIRDVLGGKIRIMLSGSATIAPSVLEFMKVCFNCNVVEGYGLTETASCISITKPYDTSLNHVGGPIVCGEICIKPLFNFGNITNDNLCGELLYRGTNLSPGYFSNQDEHCGNDYQIGDNIRNNSGWFQTGDFVEVLENGSIRVLERISNIFQLNNNKLIFPERIEKIIETSPNVLQSFIYGDNSKSNTVALVVLKDRQLCPNLEIDLLCNITKVCRDNRLLQYEIPVKVAIIISPFTIGNTMMTPTFKLCRDNIIKQYKYIINELYA